MIPVKMETVLPPYFQYPRFLLEMDLTETDRLVYMLLLDRLRLSRSNKGWTDDGVPYLYFTEQELSRKIGKSITTVKCAMKNLRKANLIRCVRQGLNSPNRIYVYIPEEGRKTAPPEGRKSGGQRAGKPTVNKNQTTKNNFKNYEYREEDNL